jgi:hypothetical protein
MKKDSRMKIVTSRIVSALILTSSALASFGCGVASEEELDDPEAEVGTLEQGLTAACGTFAAQTTYTGRVNPTLHATAAQLGAGCQGNSYIFDINDYNVGMNPLQAPLLTAETNPTTQATCEATELRYYVWDKSTSPPTFLGLASKFGVWQNDPPFVVGCDLSRSSPVALTTGNDYRFGVLARRNGSIALAVTHNFQIH